MGQNDESAEDDRRTGRIPKYRSGDEVVAWSEVDAEWWEHVQHAKAIHERVVETYLDDPGVEAIERGRGEVTIGGYATGTVNVLVADEETRARLDLPDEIEGIRITVEIGTVSDTK